MNVPNCSFLKFYNCFITPLIKGVILYDSR
nr:MAG TPA: hypothetical protein [Herelleviridae sp.]